MVKQKGFVPVMLLFILASLLLIGGGTIVLSRAKQTTKQLWPNQVSPTPSLTVTPLIIVTPSPRLWPTPTPISYRTQSCTSDNDCPKQLCQPPDQPCPQHYCISGQCQLIQWGQNPSSWEEAKRLILTDQVKEVYQTHSLLVTLVLKNGSRIITSEPKIDAVFEIVRQCGRVCSGIISATE